MEQAITDLASEVYKRLRTHSVEHAERWKALFIERHPGWVVGPLPEIEHQMYDINEFLRIELAMLNTDTVGVRSCIVDNIDANTWLRNFDKYVLQSVLTQPLPSLQWSALA